MSQGYQALRQGAAWVDLSARGRFLVRGRDRARMLHNVTSNEVKKMTPGSGCYAFLLSPQGRIQADLHLFCFEDHFLVDTEPELREKVPQLILKYKVADQVELEDITAATNAIGLEGPAAAALLAETNAPVPSEPYSHLPWGGSTVAHLTVTGQPGFRIFSPAGRQPNWEAVGAKPATEADLRLVRIENGRPRYGEDIRETSLPQETEQLQAVSFTKGCYIGQETVERIRAQGHVNKKLARVSIEASAEASAAISPGAKLMADGKEAGEITTAIYSPESGAVAALAYVRTAFLEHGTRLKAGDFNAQIV